jgi:hypothetical protein
MSTLDNERITQLAVELTRVVADSLDPEYGRDGVYEILNAIAIVTATALNATGEDLDQTREWFDHALTIAITEVRREIGARS